MLGHNFNCNCFRDFITKAMKLFNKIITLTVAKQFNFKQIVCHSEHWTRWEFFSCISCSCLDGEFHPIFGLARCLATHQPMERWWSKRFCIGHADCEFGVLLFNANNHSFDIRHSKGIAFIAIRNLRRPMLSIRPDSSCWLRSNKNHWTAFFCFAKPLWRWFASKNLHYENEWLEFDISPLVEIFKSIIYPENFARRKVLNSITSLRKS